MLKRLGQFIDTLADRANEERGLVVRLKGSEAQTPTVTYRHRVTGRLVRLVGVMHVALPSFYQRINALIDDHPESAVLYEMVGGDPSKEGNAPPEEVAKAKEQLNPLKEMYGIMAEATGCIVQYEGLPIREGWINTDLSSVEFFHELFGRKGPPPKAGGPRREPSAFQMMMAERFTQGLQQYVEQMRKPGMEPEIRKAMSQNVRMFRYSNLIGKAMEVTGFQLPLVGLIVDRRNDIGVAGILEHVRTRDVISIWGAAHLPGMGKQLREAGFEEVAREWHTVYVCSEED